MFFLFVCLFEFLLVGFLFKKNLRVWCHHREGRKGCNSSLLCSVELEEQVGVAGVHLAGIHGNHTGSIQSLSFTCHWTPAVDCVMVAHGGSEVIRHKLYLAWLIFSEANSLNCKSLNGKFTYVVFGIPQTTSDGTPRSFKISSYTISASSATPCWLFVAIKQILFSGEPQTVH